MSILSNPFGSSDSSIAAKSYEFGLAPYARRIAKANGETAAVEAEMQAAQYESFKRSNELQTPVEELEAAISAGRMLPQINALDVSNDVKAKMVAKVNAVIELALGAEAAKAVRS